MNIKYVCVYTEQKLCQVVDTRGIMYMFNRTVPVEVWRFILEREYVSGRSDDGELIREYFK